MMAKRRNPAVRIAQETAHNAVFDAHGNPKPGVHNMLLRAVEIQRPLVLAYIRRLQRRNPRASAAQLADILERDYLRADRRGSPGRGHRRRSRGRHGGVPGPFRRRDGWLP